VFIITIGEQRLTAVVEDAEVARWARPPVPGDGVAVTVRPDRLHLFDGSSGNRLPAI
jgi:multiple sugar transport system ATP-binding protein